MKKEDIEALVRDLLMRPMMGVEEDIVAASAMLADDMRFWQLGAGWVTRQDKERSWRGLAAVGLKITPTIRSILIDGDDVAVEMTFDLPSGGRAAVLFCKIIDGKVVAGREYIFPLDADEVFAAQPISA